MYKQQGDVLFFCVDNIPSNAVLQPVSGKIVVAEGEATGHLHSIAPTTECQTYTLESALFIKCGVPVTVTHEEHDSVILDPGVWRVGIVREYDHFTEEAREVTD